jgi:rieske iron-sulfur protein
VRGADEPVCGAAHLTLPSLRDGPLPLPPEGGEALWLFLCGGSFAGPDCVLGGRVDQKCHYSPRRIGRRAAIELALCLALSPRFALAQTDAARERPKEGDLLINVTAAAAPEPLKPDDVPLDGKQTLAWPMDPETKTLRNGSRLNKVLLLRLDPEGFDPETKERAAEGVVGYSAICPHTGCDVTNWHPDRQLLECPCHYSIYDPKEEAKVLSGPSPRRLPALPLKIVDGRLAVAKPFIGRPGFQQM